MKLSPLSRRRIWKIIHFLENEIKPKQFNMGTVREEHKCGTVCCVAGALPEIFPKLVTVEPYETLYARTPSFKFFAKRQVTDRPVMYYKGDFQRLFFRVIGVRAPYTEFFTTVNGQTAFGETFKNFDYRTTPKQVAAEYRKFLALAKK